MAGRRYYDDIDVGEVRESGPFTLREDEMLEFAARYDPQYFHADPQAARRSRFGTLVAAGTYTVALWRRLDHEIACDVAWICGVAWDEVRWPRALRAGDSVRARSVVLDKRPSRSDPTRGVVRCRYELVNQHDEVVWRCIATNLIETGPEPAAP